MQLVSKEVTPETLSCQDMQSLFELQAAVPTHCIARQLTNTSVLCCSI